MKRVTKQMLLDVQDWYANGKTGISSECMASYLTTGNIPRHRNTPVDPADFNRCLELLKAVPNLKSRLPKMREVSDKWAVLVDKWDALEACFIFEAGENWSKSDRATCTYYAMKGLGL